MSALLEEIKRLRLLAGQQAVCIDVLSKIVKRGCLDPEKRKEALEQANSLTQRYLKS